MPRMKRIQTPKQITIDESTLIKINEMQAVFRLPNQDTTIKKAVVFYLFCKRSEAVKAEKKAANAGKV